MRGPIMMCLAAIWSTQICAQAIIETGEHDNFTRLAINIPVGTKWKIESTPTGYTIELEGATFQNLDGFFDIIPKDRIESASLLEDTSILDLEVGCECTYYAELWRPNWLVVDILDEREITETKEQFDTSIETVTSVRPAESPLVVQDIILPIIIDELPSGVEAKQMDLANFGRSAQYVEEGRILESVIAQSLGRAFDQGLIRSIQPREGASDALPMIGTESADESGPSIGITSETALEDARVAFAPNSHEGEIEKCILDSEVDVANWRGEGSFSEQVAKHRAIMSEEFDNPSVSASLNLARTYIYYGFGREALGIIQVGNLGSNQSTILSTLAEIVDGDDVTDQNFHEQIMCRNDIALWAFLSTGSIARENSISIEELILSFKSLPNTLQVHLGPKFAEALTQIGEVEAARVALRRALDNEDQQIDLNIAAVDIEIQQGNLDEAREALSSLITNDQRTPPETLIEFVDLQLRNGEIVQDETLEMLEVMQFQYKNSALEADLSQLLVRAIIGNGQPSLALKKLMILESENPEEDYSTLNDEIAESILDSENVGLVLEYGFSNQVLKNSNDLVHQFANRLRSLGFSSRAEEISKPLLGSSTVVTDEISEDTLKEETLAQRNQQEEITQPFNGELLNDDTGLTLGDDERASDFQETVLGATELVFQSEELRKSVSSLMSEFRTSGAERQ